MLRFTFYWPELSSFHLTKDICIIPFILRKYYDYNSKILTLTNNDFSDAKKYLDNLPIEIASTEEEINNCLIDTDVLMIVGYYAFNINISYKFKQLNPHGIIFLKTDFNANWISQIPVDENLKSNLSNIDLITVECLKYWDTLNKTWPAKIEYLTQGYYDFTHKNNFVNYDNKENIILTVGRLGTVQKSTETLIDAFLKAMNSIPNWKLKLVGPCEESFKSLINTLLNNNPDLKNKIELVGPISDKSELKTIYEKSKIFCLTSIFESLPNVYPEAAANGCYIISTNLDCFYDISNFGKYGSSFDVYNVNQLADLLTSICNNEIKLKEACTDIQNFASNNFNWLKLCEKLDMLIKSKYYFK